jgi:glucose uptake protein GlcU
MLETVILGIINIILISLRIVFRKYKKKHKHKHNNNNKPNIED